MLFCRCQEIYLKKLTDCIAMLLVWLIMLHCLSERFLKDCQYLEPYFYQNFFSILNTLSDSIFANSNLSNCISCNSYSLVVFQNYSEVLVVLTQGFLLMK